MRHYRRNSDEYSRRRERAAAGDISQEFIDRVVIDKFRAGRPGQITLYELEHASPGLIPAEILQSAFQDSFDRLQGAPRLTRGGDPVLPAGEPAGVARLEWQGADVTLFESFEPDIADTGAGTFVVMFETSDDTAGRFTRSPGWDIPAVRLWVNEDWIETGPAGEWVEG